MKIDHVVVVDNLPQSLRIIVVGRQRLVKIMKAGHDLALQAELLEKVVQENMFVGYWVRPS